MPAFQTRWIRRCFVHRGKTEDDRRDTYCCPRHACKAVLGTHVCPVESMTGSLNILKEMGQKKASGAPASRAAVSKSPLLKLTTPGGTFTLYQSYPQAPTKAPRAEFRHIPCHRDTMFQNCQLICHASAKVECKLHLLHTRQLSKCLSA